MTIRKYTRPDSTFLPEFCLANICPENARIDKFQIKFPNFNLTCPNNNRFSEIIQNLRQSSLFCGGGADNKLRILKNVRGQDREWLVSGISSFSFTKRKNTYFFPSHFSLNFNEFWTCNAHRFGDAVLNGDGWANTPSLNGVQLYKSDDAKLYRASIKTLDQAHNVLFGENWIRTHNVSHCFLLQVQALVSLLRSQLKPFGKHNLHLDTDKAVLTYTEIYFDLYTADAVTHINALIQQIKPITQRGTLGEFKIDFDRNAMGCRFVSRNHINIGIYAKTDNRIRCEVRYSKSLRTILGRSTSPSGYDNSLESLSDIVNLAIEDATKRLRLVLQEAERVQQPQILSIAPTLASLMHELSIATTNNKFVSTLILNQLINKKNVTATPQIKEALKVLLERGVLTKPKAVKRAAKVYYRVSNRYLGLFEALREVSLSQHKP